VGRWLANIENRLSLQMMRSDLLRHHGTPSGRPGDDRSARDRGEGASSGRSAPRGSATEASPRLDSAVGWRSLARRAARSARFRPDADDDAFVALASPSLRVWSWEAKAASKSGVVDDASLPTCCLRATVNNNRNAWSAATSTNGTAAVRIAAQATRSNIQPGSSSRRPTAASSQLQRKTLPPDFSITSWRRTGRPNHGCNSYRTCRSSVPWAFWRRFLQRRAPAPSIGLPDTDCCFPYCSR